MEQKLHLPEQREGEQDPAPPSRLLPAMVHCPLLEPTLSQMAREPKSEACFNAGRVERLQTGSESKQTPLPLCGRVLKRLLNPPLIRWTVQEEHAIECDALCSLSFAPFRFPSGKPKALCMNRLILSAKGSHDVGILVMPHFTDGETEATIAPLGFKCMWSSFRAPLAVSPEPPSLACV